MKGWIAAFLQRTLLIPVVLGLTILLWTTLPVMLIVAGIASGFVPGWLRPLRLLWIVVLHLTLESLALLILFVYWIASGFGYFIRRPYFERLHYDLIQGYLGIFFREARRVLRLKVETVGPAPDAHPGEPLIVACRHAGPGDSFVLLYALMHWYRREPRVVFKRMLAWDPMVGLILHRLPSRFVGTRPGPGRDQEFHIGELASSLDANDCFVIFPEGGNFTPHRREKGIARLRKLGMHRMAQRAEEMTNVLPPRPGGFIAALEASPGTDVLLVAHTGLDHVLTIADVWASLPMDKVILMGWWRVPREEIPEGRDAQIDWLFTRWEEIDAWIDEHRPVDLPPARLRQRA